jgi:hypothetical protein
MSSKSSVYIRSRRRAYFWYYALSAASLVVVAAYLFLRNIHPFLAVNEPVSADVMIVEGWVPEYVVDAAVVEYASGSYKKIYVSGLESAGPAADGTQVVRHMLRSGVEPSTITLAAAPPTRWNRTSSMARAVSQAVRRSGQPLSAVNVVTLGPHGRQSRLAYQRILGRNTAVGVITVPKDDYDSRRWWASEAGIRKTLKDFLGWLRELIFGPRT